MAYKIEPQVARLRLSVREMQIEELHGTLQRVLDLAGCPSCGLSGLDFHIHGPLEGPFPEPWLETPLFREFAGAETFGEGVTEADLEGLIVIGS